MFARIGVPSWGHLIVAGAMASACTDAPARATGPHCPTRCVRSSALGRSSSRPPIRSARDRRRRSARRNTSPHSQIRGISDTRTTEQVSIAQTWAFGAAPFTAGAENLIADQLLAEHHRSEKDAARILAYANAAAFDAQIACWDAKFFYYFIRPTPADPAITVAVPLPNHPSYPSGHPCITGAIMSVLMDAFPSERDRLEEVIEIAGLSRMYGGIHYRFDIDAGGAIGRQAAALALAGSLE